MADEPTNKADGQSEGDAHTNNTDDPKDQDQPNNEPQDEGNDKVDYKTYDKVMKRLKQTESKLKDLEQERDQYKNQSLEAAGKKDEQIEELKKREKELRDQIEKRDTNFAYSQVSHQLKRAADKAGCQDPDVLMKLVDWQDFSVDDQFNVDEYEVNKAIENMKKEKPYLFQSKKSGVNDLPPSNKPNKTDSGGSKSIKQMSKEELRNKLFEVENKTEK